MVLGEGTEERAPTADIGGSPHAFFIIRVSSYLTLENLNKI